MKKHLLYPILLICLSIVSVTSVSAQQLKTSYFMDQALVRSNMNPAFRPSYGYFNIPIIGGINMNFTSNAITLDNIFIKKNGELFTFLDQSVDANTFLSKLKTDNTLDIDYSMNVLGFGFYSKKAFWSFDIVTKVNGDVSLPKSLFEFAKLGNSMNGKSYDLKNLRLNLGSTIDFALGYSRNINKKLSIGGKLKFIAGVADIDMQIDELALDLKSDKWQAKANGRINATMAGLTPEVEIRDGKRYFNDFDFDFKGLAGYGVGIDFGVAYKLLPDLTLSGAVIDLGFISWSSKNTTSGAAAADYIFEGFNVSSGENSSDQLLDDFSQLTEFEIVDPVSRTTSLRTTINIGAEYSFCNDILSAGVLYSLQMRRVKSFSELTASLNCRPADWFAASVSYSVIHSRFKTFGCAVNFSPSWIHFYLGTDYMIGKVSKQFVPISQKAANVYVGIGIPMSRQRF